MKIFLKVIDNYFLPSINIFKDYFLLLLYPLVCKTIVQPSVCSALETKANDQVFIFNSHLLI